jgi:hypothetical protein
MLTLEATGGVDNQEDNDTEGVSERQRQVSAQHKDGSSPLSQMFFVGGLGGGGGSSGVLSS